MGITEDQSIVERIRTISEGYDARKISTGEFEAAIGGAQNLRIFAPLARAIPTLPRRNRI